MCTINGMAFRAPPCINSFTTSHKFLLFYGTQVYFTMFTKTNGNWDLLYAAKTSIKILYPFPNIHFYVIFPSCLSHLDVLKSSVYFRIFDAENLFYSSHVWVNLQFKNNFYCEMFTPTYQCLCELTKMCQLLMHWHISSGGQPLYKLT